MSFAENCDLKRCDPGQVLAGVRGLIFDCDGVLFDTRGKPAVLQLYSERSGLTGYER